MEVDVDVEEEVVERVCWGVVDSAETVTSLVVGKRPGIVAAI